MTGKCQALELKGPIDRIRSVIEASSDGNEKLKGIRYYRGRRAKTYGSVKRAYTETKFTEAKPLIGIYGSQNGSSIGQLGFITLNTECQDDIRQE